MQHLTPEPPEPPEPPEVPGDPDLPASLGSLLFEQAPMGYLTLNTEGRIQHVNEAMGAVAGMARERLIRSRFEDLLRAEDRADFRRWLSCLQDGTTVGHRAVLVPPGELGVCLTGRLLPDVEPVLIAVMVSLDNGNGAVSSKASPQLSSDLWLTEVMAQAPAAVYVSEPGSACIASFVSETVRNLLGYDASVIVGQPDFWLSHVHPDDRNAVSARSLHVAVGDSCSQEYRFRHSDGHYRWLHDHARLVLNSQDQPMLVGSLLDITARKQAEDALRESESRWRYAIEDASDGLWDWDIQTDQVFLSQNLQWMLADGEQRGISGARRWRSHLHPDDAEQALTDLNAHLTGNADVYVSEHRVRRQQGGWMWVLDRGVVVSRDADGRPLRMIGIYTDISHRKRVEEALVLSEQRFRAIFDNSPECIKIIDAQGRLMRMNAAGLNFLEAHSVDEICNLGLTSFVMPDHRPAFAALFSQVMDGGGGRLEFEVVGMQGTRRWLETHATRLPDVGGQSFLMLGITRDITAQKRTLEELRSSEENLAITLQSIGDAVVATDSEGRVMRMNAMAEKLTGWDFTEARQQPLANILRLRETRSGQPIVVTIGAGRVSQRGAGPEPLLHATLVAKSGAEYQISKSAATIRDAQGQEVGWVLVLRDVSEAHRVEQALAETTEMLLRTEEMAGVGGWSLDLDAARLAWSRQTFKIHDLDVGQLPDLQRAVDFYAPLARPVISEAVRAGAERGTPWDLELPMITATGRSIWVRAMGRAVVEDGRTIRLVGTIQDISARMTAENALRVADLALKTISQGVLITDSQRRVTSANPAFETITGYAEVDLLGQDCNVLQGPDSDPAVVLQIRDCLNRDVEFHGEILNYRRDGSTFWNELSISPVRGDLGEVTHYIGITRDVTERRLAEQALRENELQMRLALRAGNLGVWDWNAGTGQLVVNDRWLSMLGLDPDGPKPSIDSWHALVHPEDLPKLQRLIETVILEPTGTHIDVEIRARHADGHWIWIHDIGSVVGRDQQGRPLRVIGTHRDISQRKQNEVILRESLREKVALLNEVHHRVKNNLQVVTSLLRLEIARSPQADIRAVLGDMKGRIRSMALLHETLYRSASLASVDLAAYLKQLATQAVRTMAMPRTSVRLNLDLRSVEVDLEQATPFGLLVNELLSNSLKHAFPEGSEGCISLSLGPVEDGTDWQMTVSDNGVGLAEDLEVPVVGSLGLQLVHDLARQLGGALALQRRPGATFTLRFRPDFERRTGSMATPDSVALTAVVGADGISG